MALVVLLALVIFLLSNRGPVGIGLWPFGALVIGFLGGLAAHLPKRYGAQRRAKRAEKRVAELEGRLTAAPGAQPTVIR